MGKVTKAFKGTSRFFKKQVNPRVKGFTKTINDKMNSKKSKDLELEEILELVVKEVEDKTKILKEENFELKKDILKINKNIFELHKMITELEHKNLSNTGLNENIKTNMSVKPTEELDLEKGENLEVNRDRDRTKDKHVIDFNIIGKISNGFYIAEKKGKFTYVDDNFKPLFSFVFDELKDFGNKYGIFKKDGLWGAINRDGKFVLKNSFKSLEEVEEAEDYFIYSRNGLDYGLLNSALKRTYGGTYLNISSYDKGYLLVENNDGKGIIDYNGNVVVNCYYDRIQRFNTISYLVYKNDKVGFYEDGEELIKPEFDSVEPFGNKFILRDENGVSIASGDGIIARERYIYSGSGDDILSIDSDKKQSLEYYLIEDEPVFIAYGKLCYISEIKQLTQYQKNKVTWDTIFDKFNKKPKEEKMSRISLVEGVI